MFAIASKSDSRKIDIIRERNQKKKQKNYTKNEAKKIESNNSTTRNNREKLINLWHHNYFAFWRDQCYFRGLYRTYEENDIYTLITGFNIYITERK